MSLRKPPHDRSNTASSDALMSPEQVEQLRALAFAARDDQAFDETLTSEEADQRIAALKTKVLGERHSGRDRRPRT